MPFCSSPVLPALADPPRARESTIADAPAAAVLVAPVFRTDRVLRPDPIPVVTESRGNEHRFRAVAPLRARWMNRAAGSRARRVIILVMGIWLLNAFDLMLTVLAHSQGLLNEENPLARALLGMGTPSIVLFKIGLVFIGSYPLLRYRVARITEMGTVVILVAYAFLAVHWNECYRLYTLTATNNVHIAEISGAEMVTQQP